MQIVPPKYTFMRAVTYIFTVLYSICMIYFLVSGLLTNIIKIVWLPKTRFQSNLKIEILFPITIFRYNLAKLNRFKARDASRIRKTDGTNLLC